VGPDNAVQILFPSKYIRLEMTGCRLIVLNFSQPAGTPSSGIISSSVADPEQVHIDFRDCAMMATSYSVRPAPPSIRSREKATERFVTPPPAATRPMCNTSSRCRRASSGWVAGPSPCSIAWRCPRPATSIAARRPSGSSKLPEKIGHDMESTPILYKAGCSGFHSHRVDRPQPDLGQMYLLIRDPATGEELSRFGRRHSLGSALVDGEVVHAFAAEHGRKPNEWFGDIDHFSSTDLKTWRVNWPLVAKWRASAQLLRLPR